MKSVADHDILQIDIGSKCHLSCSNCTHAVPAYSKDAQWSMTVEHFEKCIASIDGWYKPGRVVGLIGGEPSMSDSFPQIAKRFGELVGSPLKRPISVAPIVDLNRFATERLYCRDSGRGLWTAFGPGFYKNMEVIFDNFDHFNCNSHDHEGGLHQAMWVHREDYCKATGMSSEEWERNRNACYFQANWSGSMNDKSAYPCEIMGSIDRVLNGGKNGWKIEPGWWKRRPQDFGDIKRLCDHCSLAQPIQSSPDTRNRDIVSEKNRIALELVGAPSVTKNRFDAYDSAIHNERREVNSKDNYVANDGRRVSADYRGVAPRKITAVVTAFGADCVKQAMSAVSHNASQVDSIRIVTDHPAYRDFSDFGPNIGVSVFGGDRQFAFNKGRAINAALQAIDNPDWILLIDADTFLNPKFKQSMATVQALNPGVLYGAPRLRFASDADQAKFVNGDMTANVLGPRSHLDEEINGYFQLFNVRASSIAGRWPNVMSEEFCSAGGVDSWFKNQFPIDKQVVVKDWAVIHAFDDTKLGSRWNGPAAPTVVLNQWRQAYMMTPYGYIQVENIPEVDAGLKVEWKLTDSLHGNTVVVPHVSCGHFADVKSNGKGGFLFQGKDIGTAHIHVAYRFVKRS